MLRLACLLCALCSMLTACHEVEDFPNNGKSLQFQTDTVTFDTVFSSIGSATRFIKIYNRSSEDLVIDSIYLGSGRSNFFRINVDGVPGPHIAHIEIGAQDSIYLFCDVLIDPNASLEESPFIVENAIVFKWNQETDTLHLIAWGQHANYFPGKANQAVITTVDLQGATLQWNDPKPYIIHGLVVFENGTLEIGSGTNIHAWGGIAKTKDPAGNDVFYQDGRIVIGNQARLIVRGTAERPVVFQGVRLESAFQAVPGQWSGLFIETGSLPSQLEHAIVRNSLIGIYADSLSKLSLLACRIHTTASYGIYGRSAQITMENCLIFDTDASCVAMEAGGQLECIYATLVTGSNGQPSVYVSNQECIDFPFCLSIVRHPLKAHFVNSIITGFDGDEFWMLKDDLSGFDVQLDHCWFKIKDLIRVFPDFPSQYTVNSIQSRELDSLFVNLAINDYHLDSLSPARNKGVPIATIPLDLELYSRDPVHPNLGCFEK